MQVSSKNVPLPIFSHLQIPLFPFPPSTQRALIHSQKTRNTIYPPPFPLHEIASIEAQRRARSRVIDDARYGGASHPLSLVFV